MGDFPEVLKYSSPIDCVETNQLVINREYQDILSRLGFDSFESVWRYSGGEIVKKIAERWVTRIDIDVDGRRRHFFLKRHHPEPLRGRRLLALFVQKQILSEGRKEFDTICDFRKHKIATVIPVVAGERYAGLFRVESFLMTEAFEPFVSVEKIIRNHPEFLEGAAGAKRKKNILEAAAHLARHMHRSGFNHRDFNATHVLVWYENESDIRELALFDLQRVDRRQIFKFRWIIKTLAELNYTLPDHLFSAEERLHLFRTYKEKDRLNLWDQFQWYWIRRKTARIGRHTENMIKKRAERRKQGLPER